MTTTIEQDERVMEQIRISLSELHKTKRFVKLAEDVPIRECLFQIRYRILSGLPAYEIRFQSEDIGEDTITTDAATMIDFLNKQGFGAVLVP